MTVAQDFQTGEYPQNSIIFRQGDASRKLYVILKGKVRIYKVSPTGNETSINIFSVGDVIGEFATVDNQPRSATAKAIDDCAVTAVAFLAASQDEKAEQHHQQSL